MASQEVLIEIEPWEERVAVREAGMLTEYLLERPGERPRVGSIYSGRVISLLPSVNAALVDIGEGEAAFLPLREPENGAIRQVQRGQALMVQVVKRPLGGKRAQVTRQISLAGRYVVILPSGDGQKVSRRIEDETERNRLEEILKGITPDGFCLLARTAALGKPRELILEEMEILVAEWNEVENMMSGAAVPACLRREIPLRMRALRDICGVETERIRIAPQEQAQPLVELAGSRYRELASCIEVESQTGLFWRTGLEAELEQLLEHRVYLKGGGSLVFDFTEALTVVDVNSGHPFEEGSPEEIALRTNLEAAQEIPRQLKLRGIGGIIVVDFIDMPDPEHQKQMIEVLEAALRTDRVKTQVAVLSPLGVVEMTRKRVDDTPYHHLTDTCPVCQGRGRTLSPATLSIMIARKAMRLLREGGNRPFVVQVNPRFGSMFRENSQLLRKALSEHGNVQMKVEDDPSLGYEQFRVLAQ